ncbi:lamin tail domain-containing protein [Planococcus koreensis]|uniref:lamin tail domain-containing protein n=1 Tax=Planococcus koreensis TaxID=112331 RepID=UPI0039FDBC96
MKNTARLSLIFALIISIMAPGIETGETVHAATTSTIAINEIAWMGTSYSYNSEWIELHNTTNSAVDVSGWTLSAVDNSPAISLSGTIAAGGYYLLERTSDSSVPGIAADLIYTGSLENSDEALELRDSSGALIDSADAWYAGDNTAKATMERVDPLVAGTEATNWVDSAKTYDGGNGTPRAVNSKVKGCTDKTEQLNNVSEVEGAINVYFNKCADTTYASSGNEANYNVNLETRLINRLNQATTSIDFATYEINLPGIVDALIAKAAEGIDVRVIADAKDATDPNYVERFKTMRLQVEKMVRDRTAKLGQWMIFMYSLILRCLRWKTVPQERTSACLPHRKISRFKP